MGVRTITTVVTPASSADLLTLAVMKDELSIDSANTTLDGFLSRHITQVSATIAQYCNRVFGVETVQDLILIEQDPYVYQVPGGVDNLTLSRFPIIAVTSVVEDGNALTQDTDFKVDAKNGRLIRLGPNGYPTKWPAAPITVVYSAGYATVPPDLQWAMIVLVRSDYYARGRDPMIKQESVVGVSEAQYWVGPVGAGGLPQDIQDILGNYRTPVAI